MSTNHHSSEKQSELLKMFQQQQVTNGQEETFSQGKLNEEDEGDLYYKIACDKEKQVILLEYSHPVTWLGMDLESAEALRDKLTECLHELGGIPS